MPATLPLQNTLSSSLLSKNDKVKIHRTKVLTAVLYRYETWSHTEGGTQAEGVKNRVLRRCLDLGGRNDRRMNKTA